MTIAIFASLLTLVLRPPYAFIAYVAVALWYPKYLTVSVGTLDISAIRIVGAVLILRCLCNQQIRSQFTWSRLDTWVTISMAVYVGMYFITRPLSIALENRGGFLTDTWLAYLVARFCITNREGLITAMKWIAMLLVLLATLGIVETLTGWQPYLPLTALCPWRPEVRLTEPRTGLYRAIGSFGHPILFGCCFAMFLPLIYCLRYEQSYRRLLAYVISAIIAAGCLSSMSSGPWLMLVVVIFCMAMERKKHWVKPLLILFALLCIGVEIISNRPFYHAVLSRMNPVGGAWWHRAKLIDCAVDSFREWFLLGYKGQDPGWGFYLGSDHSDVTNQFIMNGVEYGILGIIVLCAVLIVCFQGLISTYKKTNDPFLKSFCWALGCMLFSVIVSWLSTCYFSQMLTLFYSLLGVVGSVTGWQNSLSSLRNGKRIHMSFDTTAYAPLVTRRGVLKE
ncbi:MAG: O-antigen ligase family protein [Planctomycetota bacterium]